MNMKFKKVYTEKLNGLSDNTKGFIFNLMNGNQDLNDWIFADYDNWEIKWKKSRTSLRRCIKELEDFGFLVRSYSEFKGAHKLITNKLYIRLNIFEKHENFI